MNYDILLQIVIIELTEVIFFTLHTLLNSHGYKMLKEIHVLGPGVLKTPCWMVGAGLLQYIHVTQ